MAYNRGYIANSNAFGTILKLVWLFVLIVAILCLVKSCAECSFRTTIVQRTGYLPDNEDWHNIPDVQPPYADDDTLNLPPSVMLEHLFPPVGDQGDKGTCVAWAAGYNLKTALNAIDSAMTPAMLAMPQHQTSPKDLWLCIPQSQRNSSCSGTGFEAAFNTLKTTGAASMASVPYGNMQSCNGSGVGDTNNRIENYYKVNSGGRLPDVGQLKAYLADTIPLVVGARLGDRFMRWKSDGVIAHDTYNYTGMHAYHAMALVGYDDGRHAFRLRNSWGTKWGDNGSIWVDYNFFCNEMCYVVLMAENHTADSTQHNFTIR